MLSARIIRDRPNRVLYMDQNAAIARVAEKCGIVVLLATKEESSQVLC